MTVALRHSLGRTPGRPSSRRPRARFQLPLTPMIDVTFQLLLFFLLATTFRQAEGQIPAALPHPQSAGGGLDQTIIRPIRLSVLPAGEGVTFRLQDAPAPLADADALYRALLARRQAYGSGEVPVAIEPRWDVPWQHVVEADNQARRAGFVSVGIVSSP